MYEPLATVLKDAKHVVIIQAENPDGDSLGSSIALEELLGNMGIQVSMYCHVAVAKYLRYINGWDRVTNEWTGQYDAAIIVDTTSDTLISQLLETPGARHWLETHPVLVLDHHSTTAPTLSFPYKLIMSDTAVATGELIYDIANDLGWKITTQAANALYTSIMADSLGLTTQATTAGSYRAVAGLVDAGVVPAELEARRREMMKKPANILEYKGELIKRIEYMCDGKFATVHIPWEDIAAYSDQYNPSVLVLDEMRLVEGVEVAVAIKTYPDGKVTGKLRSNLPISDAIAGYFGGGGHQYAAGFRVYDSLDTVHSELRVAFDKAYQDYNKDGQS